MGVLDQVVRMQSQGMTEDQIINQLRQDGVPPKQITDALSHSRIKSAVSGEYPNTGMEGMEQSIIDQGGMNPEAGMQNQEYAPQSQEYGNYPMQQQEYYSAPPQSDNTLEIAEQVFAEKSQKIIQQVKDIQEFKTIAETKIDSMNERLKKIESIIDKLQASILHQVGSYGDNLESIKKEMSMMQESFGKVIKSSSESKRK